MLFVFAKRRDEDQPWWDDDAETRARNLSTELALNRHMHSVLNLTGGDGPEPPQDGGSMPPIVAAALKYGLTPVLLAWLVWIGASKVVSNQERTNEDIRTHMLENRTATAAIIERQDRADRISDRIVNLLRQQCVNAAKNNQERNDCLRAGQ